MDIRCFLDDRISCLHWSCDFCPVNLGCFCSDDNIKDQNIPPIPRILDSF